MREFWKELNIFLQNPLSGLSLGIVLGAIAILIYELSKLF